MLQCNLENGARQTTADKLRSVSFRKRTDITKPGYEKHGVDRLTSRNHAAGLNESEYARDDPHDFCHYYFTAFKITVKLLLHLDFTSQQRRR